MNTFILNGQNSGMIQPIDLLLEYWKHSEFRNPQEAIIQNVLANKDTFALLPTGGGKSICFQIPSLILPGICLVISPLIALIEDQVQNLQHKGIKATAIVGSNSMEDISAILDNCMYGDYKFLYLAPERLQQPWILERLEKLKINLIAIDEAHCVSQWGHDFRPAYLQIHKLKEIFPNKPFIALTASANLQAQNDIIELLKLDNPTTFKKSFYRDNLYYGVYKVEDKEQTIIKILRKNPVPTIIYARNRKQCQLFSEKLNQLNFQSTFFHGGLSSNEKKKRLQSWLDEKTPIIVATNAFGMGIDKDNVKNVIHIQIPENIESYYQEAGRAGRNGEKAFTTLLINHEDIQLNHNSFSNTLFDKDFLLLVYRKLNNYLRIAYGEGFNTQHSFNFNAFCTLYKLPTKKTFNVLQFLDRQSIVKFSQNFGSKTNIQFTASSSVLLDYASTDEEEENFLLHLIRNYPGINEFKIDLNLEKIAELIDSESAILKSYLLKWQENELCIYEPEDNDISMVFCEAREDDRTLYRTLPYLKQQNDLKKKQFKSMLFYVENNDICKNKIILHYFDEECLKDCEKCSSCLKKRTEVTPNLKKISQDITSFLNQGPKSIENIEDQLKINSKHIQTAIMLLLEENKITPNENNQYTLK